MSDRTQIYLLGYPSPTTEYVLFPPGAIGWPDPAYARQWLDQNRPPMAVYDRDGWVVWKRRA